MSKKTPVPFNRPEPVALTADMPLETIRDAARCDALGFGNAIRNLPKPVQTPVIGVTAAVADMKASLLLGEDAWKGGVDAEEAYKILLAALKLWEAVPSQEQAAVIRGLFQREPKRLLAVA